MKDIAVLGPRGTFTDCASIVYKQKQEKNINVVSIMSRPTKKSMGKYNFFIELAAQAKDKDLIIETIDRINEEFHVKILGIYSNI